MQTTLPFVIVVVGPTASGKSDLAVRLAERIDGEVVNADSMQLYRGMEIGTARPSLEMMCRVPHHLFGIVDPDVNFTAADYSSAADVVISDISRRGRVPVIVGGTGLYIRALLHGLAESPAADDDFREEMERFTETHGAQALHDRLASIDPESASRLHVNDRLRIIRALEVYHQTGRSISSYQSSHGFNEKRYHSLAIGLDVPRNILYERIGERVDAMVSAGLVGEVEGLLAKGYSSDLKALGSIGYREICLYLQGAYSLPQALEEIKRNTRRYAKRQITWFRRDPEIIWFDYSESFVNICQIACDFIKRRGL